MIIGMDYTRLVPDRFKLYLFDLDGTLVDSLADLAQSVNWILEQKGYAPVDRETVRRSVGNGARNLLIRCFAHSAEKQSPAGLPAPTDPEMSVILGEYRAYYDAHCTAQTALYPGMREWLDHLASRGVAMAVLSNKPVAASISILRALDAERYFSVIAGPETTGTLKPDPAGVALVLGSMGCPEVETLLVGDSFVDIETARNAGVSSCGITGGIGDDAALRASAPDYLIERA